MELRSITLCGLFQNVNFDTVDPQRVRVIGHLDLVGPLFLDAQCTAGNKFRNDAIEGPTPVSGTLVYYLLERTCTKAELIFDQQTIIL